MSEQIALLNNRFRKGDISLGQYNLTAGVQVLPQDNQLERQQSL